MGWLQFIRKPNSGEERPYPKNWIELWAQTWHPNFILTNDDWDEIKIYVDSMGDNFTERLKTSYPNLNEDDVKFMMLVSLRLPSKTMATIYNISDKGIRQRLFLYKSKVEIDGESISLRTFIEGFWSIKKRRFRHYNYRAQYQYIDIQYFIRKSKLNDLDMRNLQVIEICSSFAVWKLMLTETRN